MKRNIILMLLALLMSILLIAGFAGCTSGNEQETDTLEGQTSETDSGTDETETDHIHAWSEWNVTDATCTENGEKVRQCTSCGETEKKIIISNGHTYEGGFCIACQSKEPTPSEGLEFTLHTDGNSYFVSGIGSCTDTDIVIPAVYNGKPVTSIGARAFASCDTLTSVMIMDGVSGIEGYAFHMCSNLTSVTIPDSVTRIDEVAFGLCGLTDIRISEYVTSIGEGAFSCGSSIKTITVSENNPNYYAVENCLIEAASKTLVATGINSVIPTDGSVTCIGFAAFAVRDDLTSITIPDIVTSMGNEAFVLCSHLTDVTIGNGITYIGDYTFVGCSNLTNLTILGCVTFIDDAFIGCGSLMNIEVSSQNTVYHSEGNCLISTADKILIRGGQNSVIPDDGSVTRISAYAFDNCSNLTSIVIPNSVTDIGFGAFGDCGNLTSIIFKGTIEQWNAINKHDNWDENAGSYTVHCTDGDIDIQK